MKMKSLKSQFIAAIAMVLVAAIAMGSSTYAWFAGNGAVKAIGMQVTAATEGGIEIAFAKSTDSNSSFATVATAGVSTSPSLYPTSTDGSAASSAIATGNWYHASAEAGNASTAKINTRSTLSLSAGDTTKNIAGSTTKQDATQYYDSDGGQYFLVKNFNIRSTSSTALARGLSVEKVNVASTVQYDFSDSLRVAIVLGDKVLFYAPVSEEGITDIDGTTAGKQYKVYSGFTGEGTTQSPFVATEAGTITITNKDTKTLLAASADTTIPSKGQTTNGGVDVGIYIYFEGEDAKLYSQNFNVDTLVVEVDFSATV